MKIPHSLLFATTLCLVTLCLVSVAVAQGVTSARVSPDTTTAELRFQAGDLLVRRWTANETARAAVSRDGGHSWQQLGDPDDRLHFVFAQYDPLRNPMQLAGAMAAPAGNRLFLVQFQTQILDPYQVALEQRGVEILHYLPENALFVRCDRSQLAALRNLPFVRWVGDLQNACKLDAALREFANGNGPAAADKVGIECNLILARKSDRKILAAQIDAIGGEVTNLCDGSVMIQAKLTQPQLLEVMALDTVTWADPTTAVGYDMDNARVQGGGNYVETLGGYTGAGVRAEITEAFDDTHIDFTNIPARVLVRGTNTTGNHGHCTAGIVGGNGTGNSAARGMMPDCWLIEGPYSAANHYAQIVGSTNPALNWKTMVATASWGSAQTALYTSISQSVDDALFDSDLTRLNSQSNLGNQNSRPEAWAKNIISGGGVAHGDNASPADDVWTSASYGPASDGRFKPDICAYYDNVLTSDRTGANGYNTGVGTAGNYYTGFNGTSSATPIVAGHLGLMQQMFTDGLFGNPLPLPATAANRFQNKPHMSTSKALLCGTASPYPQTQVLRRVQGWGFPDLARLYDNREKILVVDEYEALRQGQQRLYFVWVPPGSPEFRATMCYTDPEAQANAAIHRVNNLNLKVTRFTDGTSWWGNNGLWAGDESTSGGTANDRDTIECVLLNNPQPGLYAVAVEAPSIVQDGRIETPAMDADFALVTFPLGGGYQNNSTMTVDLQSNSPAHFSVSVANLPAVPWTDGFTYFSLNTVRPLGFGNWFGIEFDFLVSAIWTLPATSGDVFHFTNTPGGYPYLTYTFPPSLISGLTGFTVDAHVMLLNAGQVVAESNIDRVTLQ